MLSQADNGSGFSWKVNGDPDFFAGYQEARMQRSRWVCAWMFFGIAAMCGALRPAVLSGQSSITDIPAYTAEGRLLPPSEYRQWIYLTSGLGMSYTPQMAGMEGMSMFDNVFVSPAAWKSFQSTGTWPDKTMLVLEQRGAESKNSINKAGHSQSMERMGMEVHLKDAAHGGWAFYEFDGNPEKMTPAAMVPLQADCYSCHREHAAVDTTFVQFYPTLLPVARAKGTLSAAYLKELGK